MTLTRSGNEWRGSIADATATALASQSHVKSGDKVYPAYHGNGNGGQLLLVVSQFDLAVMFTAGNYRQGLWNRERDDIVGAMIIPALAGAAPAAQAAPWPSGAPPLPPTFTRPCTRIRIIAPHSSTCFPQGSSK